MSDCRILANIKKGESSLQALLFLLEVAFKVLNTSLMNWLFYKLVFFLRLISNLDKTKHIELIVRLLGAQNTTQMLLDP